MKKKTIIIAEIGVNHNGSLNIAKKLILAAKKSGADYVKFQTWISDEVFSKHTPKAKYQKKNTIKDETALELANKLEWKIDKHYKSFLFCKKNRIKYLTTFHDIKSLKFLKKFDLDFLKIGSGDITNFPFLKECAKFKKKILLSTGASSLQDVKKCLKYLTKNGVKKKNLVLMQCNSAYPTPLKDINLNVLKTYKKKFGTELGFSDHSKEIHTSIPAVCLGANYIEKHFTLDEKMKGPDHQTSLNPKKFKEMVSLIRDTEVLLGSNDKKVSKSEKINQNIIRKSIFASRDIVKGEKFSLSNLSVKRPEIGLKPSEFEKVLGKKAKKFFFKDDPIYKIF